MFFFLKQGLDLRTSLAALLDFNPLPIDSCHCLLGKAWEEMKMLHCFLLEEL
jgi:hypothetical protein